MTPWHSDVFGIVSVHLTLLSHSPPTICSTVIVDSWLPRAKLCCFSANSDRCDSRSRRSDGPKRCIRASMNFNTFARCIFLRLARSCRVVEKFDKNHRFFMIFCDRAPRSERSDRISPQRGTISANGEIQILHMHWTSCLRVYSAWVYRSVELCCHNDRILLKNSTIWLSGADRIGFLRNAVLSRKTEKNPFAQCIERYDAALTASESIGALRNACYSVRFCWKTT